MKAINGKLKIFIDQVGCAVDKNNNQFDCNYPTY